MLFLSSLYFCFDNALTSIIIKTSVPSDLLSLCISPGVLSRHQVLEEDASVVNPMISSALPRCVHGVGIPHRYGKLGELASVKSSTSPGVLTSIISVCYFCDLCIFVSITPDIIKNFCPSVSLQACKSSPRRGRVCR